MENQQQPPRRVGDIAYRIEKGLPAKHLENWVRSSETAEYVAVLEREFKSVAATDYKNPLESA